MPRSGRPTGRPRLYSCDEEAFDVLTPHALYWCGFLYADGCVVNNKKTGAYRVALSLARRDVGHLTTFKAHMRATHKIHETSCRINGVTAHACYVRINSKRLITRLIALGIIPNKSRLGRGVCSELAISRDFWRGVVDGDGCITSHKGHPRLSLAGDQYLLSQWRAYLADNLPSVRGSYGRVRGVHIAQFGNADSAMIIRHLYRDAVVALPRKLARAQTVIDADGVRAA